MNLYNNKARIKIGLIVIAIVIGILSLWYTDDLVKKLAEREQKLIDLYAKGLQQIANPDNTGNMTFLFQEIIEANNSIPVILTDEKFNPVSYKNITPPTKLNEPDQKKWLKKRVTEMREGHEPILVDYEELGFKNYIFYENSYLLKELTYYPYIQLGAIAGLVLLGFLAFSYSKKSEQNKLWVGLSKETAHQLGTPLSGLMAWVEILKNDERLDGDEVIHEIDKDVQRLAMITERFSNIGSLPSLKAEPLEDCLQSMIDYLSKRTSGKVEISLKNQLGKDTTVQMNRPLFEWVIENICKNAIDAMSGVGKLHLEILASEKNNMVAIDIKDTGKGIPKADFKRVFMPGVTTKQRGWGLGLTLVKRIVEEYHNGKIFVKSSEQGKGTTFRILLKH